MPYLPESTVAATLRDIQSGDLILPAIQREFVWSPAQVVALFDSLMRGYPIGSFLSWKVDPQTAEQFRFYAFLRDYNELNQRHNPELDVPPNRSNIAVLDGQQRLTSLNIGLRGSYAWKKKWGWSRFVENFPRRVLHLNIAHPAPENTAGLQYDFRFLTDEQLKAMDDDEARSWLPVPAVFDATKINTLVIELTRRSVGEGAMERAMTLWEKVHSERTMHFYQETAQDIERVLDIFIRVNSSGSPLSYSDLLLSIATAQWTERDARKEIHSLVDDLNATGVGFNFTKDLVLKAGLVLSGVKDTAFKVKNFTTATMATLEQNWDRVGLSLRVAAGLLSDFGLSAANLTARSVLIPVATYIHLRGLDHGYREAPSESSDRSGLRSWVLRSLVVPGVWGSGLDTLLQAIRGIILEHGEASFPVSEIEATMASRGKSLALTPELLESLLDLEYGNPATFAVLSVLFPHVNTRNEHHVDHVYPISRLSDKRLKALPLADDVKTRIVETRNKLAALELLEGKENIAKSDKEPAAWAAVAFPTSEALEAYLDRNALPGLPAGPEEFLTFYEQRRDRLRALFGAHLGVQAPAEIQVTADDESVVEPIDQTVEVGDQLGA